MEKKRKMEMPMRNMMMLMLDVYGCHENTHLPNLVITYSLLKPIVVDATRRRPQCHLVTPIAANAAGLDERRTSHTFTTSVPSRHARSLMFATGAATRR
jgi:hypothetical protein